MALPKKVYLEALDVNVYDVEIKEIIFTGSKVQCAKFLGIHEWTIHNCLKRKSRYNNKYAFRNVKSNQ